MEERKRKLFFYSLPGDGGIEWEKAKKRRLNLFAGTGPGSSETRVKSVVQVFDLLQAAEPDEEVGRRNVLCMMARLNTNKTKNPTDLLRKTMTNKMATVATALVDPDPTDLLSRFRRGRRPFQGNVEEKILMRSTKGLHTEARSSMKYLRGDTFFSRFPVNLLPMNQIPQCTTSDYVAIFANDDEAGDRCEEAGV